MVVSQEAQARAYLRSPRTIRSHCQQIGKAAEAGSLRYFHYQPEKLAATVAYVVAETQRNYPSGRIPIHGRLRHLAVGGVDRAALIRQRLAGQTREEIVRAVFEAVVVSVLLDGGAGAEWSYHDGFSPGIWQRSEGLALASFALFWQGEFSSRKHRDPLRVEAPALEGLTVEQLGRGMQASADKPLLGLAQRAVLLQTLGKTIREKPQFFARNSEIPRLAGLFDYLVAAHVSRDDQGTTKIAAEEIFSVLLESLADIWPHGLQYAGANLGDIGVYGGIVGEFACHDMIPFHKLTQWLSYSLFELFEELGIKVVGGEQLTGLPEYRNGGLLLDSGVLVLKHPEDALIEHEPTSELIVEWRALTVYLLDQIAEGVRLKLGKSPEELPLGCVLQGGTWSAGRRLAREKRGDGSGPLIIKSDGTIF